jgi:hypothetical protein
MKIKFLALTVCLFLVGCKGNEPQPQTTETTNETEQQYIIRYGNINGDEIITEDGNLWLLIDPPVYNKGAEVRVLFDSKGTVEVEDDVIIDITKR